MRVVIVGCGVVGARAARQILDNEPSVELCLVDERADHAALLAATLGSRVSTHSYLAPLDAFHSGSEAGVGLGVLLLTRPAPHCKIAREAIQRGLNVVSVSDSLEDIQEMLGLHSLAAERNLSLVIGAGFSPGLTCLLAKHASSEFDTVHELHVAKFGTAGPACARQHHQALATSGRDWRDGEWVDVLGGSGRELCWFPDPIAGADCYRAALGEPLLLKQAFPAADRITARMSATRRDRFTASLPMMRKPHPEAGLGAVRVELRGLQKGRFEVVVFGCVDRPSIGAATVAATAVSAVAGGDVSVGAGGLATMVPTAKFLGELARRGVKCARFVGAASHLF